MYSKLDIFNPRTTLFWVYFRLLENLTMQKKNLWKLFLIAVLIIGSLGLLAACSPTQAQPDSPAVALTTEASASLPLPQEIRVDEAAELWDTGTFLLDVRQPEEWDQVYIPNTTLIPLGELPDRLDELPDDQQIVVVCRSGNRSMTGTNILLEAGYDPADVASMAGGVTEWEAKGYPVVR